MSQQIRFVLRGTSPLLCHNPQMVDPECVWNREIKTYTSKRKKTDDDMKQIERLEWYGGIYTAEIDGSVMVTQPTSKVRKCLINAAKISRQGKQIERAVIATELNVPLLYDDREYLTDITAELDRLQRSPVYNSRLSVGIGNKRVMRVRPQFSRWAMVVPAMFLPDAGLNFDELQSIFDLAGRAERIGDNRVNGYGAFVGRIANERDKIEPGYAGVMKFLNTVEKKKGGE